MQNPFAPRILAVAILLSAVISAKSSVQFTTLVTFNGTNGAVPLAGLAEGLDGKLYGTASEGGTNNGGTVFVVSHDGSTFSNLYYFTGGAHGANPSAMLLGTGNGFMGTTFSGGASNCGTVFMIGTDGSLTTLASFSVTNGANPDIVLTPAADGSFFGGTEFGGPFPNPTSGGNGYGVIFNVTTNGTLTTPVLLAKTNGTNPGPFTQGSDGNFYGTTAWGGRVSPFPLGFGTVFRMSPDGTYTNIYIFTGFNDGGFPYSGLIQGSDGSFYGTAFNGGSVGFGTIYRITSDGQFTLLHTFTGGTDGSDPYGTLVEGPDGKLYGTCYNGGDFGFGTVFEFLPQATNGIGNTLAAFTGTIGPTPGGSTRAKMIFGSDGALYGTTSAGGAFNLGTVFRLSIPLPPVFKSIVRTNGGVALTWSAVAGQTYQLQFNTNLGTTNWSNLNSSFVATNGLVTVSDSTSPDPQRFYRVVLIP